MGKKIHVKEMEMPKALKDISTQTLELRDLRLLKSVTFIDAGVNPLELPKEVHQQIQVHCGREAEQKTLVYMMAFSLKARTESGQEVMSIEATFGLVYRFENLDGIDDVAAQVFGQTTGLFCIWPYWREFVGSSASRMGLPPIRIPLMRPSDMQFTQPQKAAAPMESKGRKRRK